MRIRPPSVPRRARLLGLALLVIASGAMAVPARPASASARQEADVRASDDAPRLRARVLERWRVVPLRDGVLLVPRRSGPVGGVELTGRGIAIDGHDVSGAELRERLGADADVVLALSYLDADARAATLFPDARPGAERPVVRIERSTATEAVIHRRHGARVRIGGDVTVADGEQVGDAAVAILGSVVVDGEVNGDAVAVAGDVRLGPKAVVRGNAVAVGGRLVADPAARIYGEITEVGLALPPLHVRWPDADGVRLHLWPSRRWFAGAALAGTLIRFLLIGLLAGVFLLLMPRAVEQVRDAAAGAPLAAFAVGFAAELLLVPAVVALCLALVITIVGIPLLALVPIGLLLLALAWALGAAAVAEAIGQRALGAGAGARSRGAALAIGLLLVGLVSLVGRLAWWMQGSMGGWLALVVGLGVAIEFVVASVAAGALVLAWWNRRARPVAAVGTAGPPPVPSAPVSLS